MKKTHYLQIVFSILVLVLVLASCRSAESTLDSAGSTAYETLLELVPDTSETRSHVLIGNYALAREIFDVPLPESDATEQEMENYYRFSPPLWVDGQPDYYPLQGPFLSDGYNQWRPHVYLHRRQYLAFDIRNEDQTLQAGTSPIQLEVLRGRFDPEATDRALSTCKGECTPPDTLVEHRGLTFYSWGEDLEANPQKRLASPAFDQLGRGGRILVQDNYVLRTLTTEAMKSAIDAKLADGRSLAEVEEYRILARGMSELGAYGVFMTDLTQGFDEMLQVRCSGSGWMIGDQDCIGLGAELQKRGPMLRPYQVLATGVGSDDSGAYTALVLVHDDKSSASDNVELLRRRISEGYSWGSRGQAWSGFFDSDNLDVWARGRVLLAKIRSKTRSAGGRPPLWITWVVQQDPFLLHE